MNPEQIRAIIRTELAFLFGSKLIFERDIQILNGRDIQVGKGVGTRIGTEATQKLGFYGATPIARQTSPGHVLGGATVDSQARSIINQVVDDLVDIGIYQ